MVRSVIGVVVGYVAMALLAMLLPIVLMLVAGLDGIFQSGSWSVKGWWVGVNLANGLFAGLVGGLLCKLISRRQGAVVALCVVMGLLGAMSAVMWLGKEDPGPREASVSEMEPAKLMQEVAEKSRVASWYYFAIPVVGIAGVLGGASLVKERRAVKRE